MSDKCEEFSLAVFGESVPLQVLLADIFQLPHAEYCPAIMSWLREKAALLPQVQNWLAARSLTLEDYVAHMLEEGWCDGLELWLFCMAANVNTNVIQEDHTWSALCSGLNFADPTFILTDYGIALLCLPEEDDAQEESILLVQDTQNNSGLDPQEAQCAQGGHPLGVWASSSTASSTSVGHQALDMDTEVEELFDTDMTGLVLLHSPGKAKARVCPVCGTELFSGLVLIDHIKITHQDVQ